MLTAICAVNRYSAVKRLLRQISLPMIFIRLNIKSIHRWTIRTGVLSIYGPRPWTTLTEAPEPETIEFELNTGTQATEAYDIFPGYRWEYRLVDVTGEKKSFQFSLKEKIKPGSVLITRRSIL